MKSRPISERHLPYAEGVAGQLSCRAVGGYPPPSIWIYLSGVDITDHLLDFVFLDDRGLSRLATSQLCDDQIDGEPGVVCPGRWAIRTMRGCRARTIVRLREGSHPGTSYVRTAFHCDWFLNIIYSDWCFIQFKFVSDYVRMNVETSFQCCRQCWNIVSILQTMLRHRFNVADDVETSFRSCRQCWNIVSILQTMLRHRFNVADNVDTSFPRLQTTLKHRFKSCRHCWNIISMLQTLLKYCFNVADIVSILQKMLKHCFNVVENVLTSFHCWQTDRSFNAQGRFKLLSVHGTSM